MKWYTDYLSTYEKPYSELPPRLTDRVKKRIKQLQAGNPLVSVVVIAHNEESRIFPCLWSISENQCLFCIEIIVVNNHSTDNTENILKELGVRYYNEEKKGPGFARQCGLNYAKGKYCLCMESWRRMPFGASSPIRIIHQWGFFYMKRCVTFILTFSIYKDLNSMCAEWSLDFGQTRHAK